MAPADCTVPRVRGIADDCALVILQPVAPVSYWVPHTASESISPVRWRWKGRIGATHDCHALSSDHTATLTSTPAGKLAVFTVATVSGWSAK